MNAKKILIGGEWREASETFTVVNPFSNESIAEIYSVNEKENEEAVAIAESGSKEMQKLARFEIAQGLRKIADGIEKRKAEFAKIIAEEAAKPIKLARGEVKRAIATFAWAAGEAERFVGEIIPVDTMATGSGKTAQTKLIIVTRLRRQTGRINSIIERMERGVVLAR